MKRPGKAAIVGFGLLCIDSVGVLALSPWSAANGGQLAKGGGVPVPEEMGRSPAGALRLRVEPGLVRLQTSVVSLRRASDVTPAAAAAAAATAPSVDLISSVHLADSSYFQQICDCSLRYDRFLFELIAPEGAIEAGPDGLPRIASELMPTSEQEAMADAYNLVPQLSCMDYRALSSAKGSRWVLADVTTEVLDGWRRAQNQGAGGGAFVTTLSEIVQALLVGRFAEGNMLPKFFRGAGLDASARAFRALLWLAPCPEAQVLALDWGRAYPRAGGLSSLLWIAVDCLSRGDFTTPRKLAFAQQLCSNQVDGGASNGYGVNSKVLVLRRNEKVVRALERAQKDGCSSVGVFYGALHMQDLQERLSRDMGLSPVGEPSWIDAWSIPVPTGSSSANPFGQTVLGFVLGGGFVTIGVLDWFDTIVRTCQSVEGDAGLAGLAAGMLTVSLYILRHASIYYALSKWLVRWDTDLLQS
jgi:hypothetical protein